MKPALKITFLLGAVMAGGIGLWLYHQAHLSRHQTAETYPTNASTVSSSPLTSGAPRPSPVPPANVPESIRPIMDSFATFTERVKAVHALNAELTAEEAQAFHAYLLMPAQSGPETRQEENWLRNVMMDKLAEQPNAPTNFARVLVSIFQDKEQDVVMRDYAVQHMTPIYERTTAEEKTLLRQTLWQAVEETGSSIAGTALLALGDLAQDQPEIEKNKLAEAALKMAGDQQCGELSRVTAVQVCGRMGMSEAAPVALELAQNAGSIPLQIAAIAALGDMGDQQARAYLQQINADSEPRLKPAIETALKKMNKRLGG
jgi:hypothetical protein